jgi:hypothetical protein
MSWTCPRCHTSNDNNKYYCAKCNQRDPGKNEAHYRWKDWKCPKCSTSNGGAFKKCAKCGTRNPT